MTDWIPGKRVLQARTRLADLRGKYAWSEDEADRAVRFIERNLRHWKEPFTGKPFLLSPWQRDEIIRPIWGLRRPDGTRLVRELYLQVPRKNGKTALAAAIALLVLCGDGHGVEVYSAATMRDQARIVYRDVSRFIAASPALRKRLRANKTAIEYPDRAGLMRPLSSEAQNLDGLNVSCAIIDELHAHPSADLHDVIMTATGTRSQPLVVKITTAGSGTHGICHDQFEYACRVLDGTIQDDAYLAFIAEADPDLSWDDPAAYCQANPNLGVSIRADYLEREREKAVSQPSYRSTFERYHLDRWVTHGVESWLGADAWQRCEGDWALREMEGVPCWGAFDLATVADLTAFALVWKHGGQRVRSAVWYWLPEEDLAERCRRDRVPYDQWARDGWLTLTPGPVVDFERVAADIIQLARRFRPADIAYDDWNAAQVVARLEAARLPLTSFIQGVRSFHPPTQEFERLVVSGELEHDGSPVTTWCASNTHILRDASGKIRPVKVKKSATQRIDGTVAQIMALDCLMRAASTAAGDTLRNGRLLPETMRALLGA